MAKIPTAEEFLKDLQHEYEETGEYKMYFAIDIPNKLKEFAKMHVEAALKEASEKALVYADEGGYSEFVDEQSILNSYSLENIK
jgi:hypothetical protein